MTRLRKIYKYNKFSYHGKKIVAKDFFPYLIEVETGRRIVPVQVFAKCMGIARDTVLDWRKDGLLPVCIKVKVNEDNRGGSSACFLVSDLEVFFNENVYFSDGDI